MKNKKYYSLWVLTLALIATFISCEEDGDVRDGIRDVSFKATAKNRNITEGGAITYIDSSSNVTSRLWTFVEGSIPTSDQATVDVNYPTGQSLNEEGRIPGYLTTLEVTHDDGTIEKGEFLVGVYKKVNVEFSASETEVIVGTASTFTAEVENLQSLFLESREDDLLEWTFEGGTPATSTSDNPTITYNTLGTYKVTLTAHRESPLSEDSKSVEGYITVVEPIPVVPEFTANAEVTGITSTVTYTDESSGAVDAWLWTFPGGLPATSTEQNPTVVYNELGSYDVTLVATRTGDNASETITKTGYITVDSNIVIGGNNDGESADLSQWTAVFEDFITDRSENLSVSNTIFAPGGGSGSILYSYNEAGPGVPGFTDINIDYLVEINVTEAGSYTVALDHFGDITGGAEYVFNLGFVNTENLGAFETPLRAFQGRFAADTWNTASATVNLPVGKYYVRLAIFNPGFSIGQNIDLYMDNVSVIKN
ncbi:PKD domain-containing protein [Maribacter aquivivus]|uniref:PKD domain-containing protein n=1 Tax=Maribacter aquivivus TaxID=228958 RepID=UPI002492D99E|nr:PKD domain-containing protein [Maribacter aquivivus]